ncbi:hypothetical protein C5S31_04485 [ANME-1 cluster archaeon GoMg2]|nr:hypothetical protein [ANME-1 cluster archaeon GoMg2]
MNTKVFALIIACAVMLVTTATASSAISITDAEAVYEVDLRTVSVPTDAVPLETVFIATTADASIEQDLTEVNIPTTPVPLKTVFIAATADATSIEQDLTEVSVPTSPVPVKKIFIHNEDAKRVEELVYPKGLLKDFISPVITNITVTEITDSSAVIKWDTDEFADSLVKYGKTSGVYTESVESATVVKNHTVELTGLLPATEYYFVVNSTDRSENSAESTEGSFCTLEGPAPTPTPTPQRAVFDTGSGTYPSISGTHNGTLKPNQTVKVSELYMYPCPGTGGHSEYIKIRNDSDWNITASWQGYKDDWRNISFDSNFTLEAGENYSYTLITGSYPQIHHTDNLSTSCGFITCSEFVDANGKRYDRGIPAIRLWA